MYKKTGDINVNLKKYAEENISRKINKKINKNN